MSPGAPLLALERFAVRLGPQAILRDVTLALPRRGLTVLVGPAGAGKSTLLRTLAGLNDAHPALATSGDARLDGAPLAALPRPPHDPTGPRRGVGFVMQHARFFLDSVRENLVSALPDRSSLDAAAQRERVGALLRECGLEELGARLDDDVASLPTPLQRRLAVVRALAGGPALLLADEPTAGLDDDDAVALVSLLRVQARERAVVYVTHNQRLAVAAGGTTALLAAGRIAEVAPTHAFFTAPATVEGRRFVRTGGFSPDAAEARDGDEPSPGAPATEDLAARPRTPSAPPEPSRFLGPRGFFWVWSGQLGGLPRPGIVDDLAVDLEGLQRLGVTTLVTLEETATVPGDALRAAGLEAIHFPIDDMGCPTPEAAAALCARVEARLAGRGCVALHCRAGLGRTGTMLACQLVWSGERARAAIEAVRRLNHRCIQSGRQVEFLSAFEHFIGDRGVRAPGPVNNPTSERST